MEWVTPEQGRVWLDQLLPSQRTALLAAVFSVFASYADRQRLPAEQVQQRMADAAHVLAVLAGAPVRVGTMPHWPVPTFTVQQDA